MCRGPGEDIGHDVHQNVDQFFGIEEDDQSATYPMLITITTELEAT
jgi:hypothetical protein